jgi:hypothetical protein
MGTLVLAPLLMTGRAEGSSVCASGSSLLDQSQLASNGNLVVAADQTVAQVIVVGKTGVLTGVEANALSCNGIDPQAQLQLTVLSNGVNVGSATLNASSVPETGCPFGALSSTSVGPGFFDLSSACIHVTAGQTLTLQFTASSPSVACSPNGICTAGVLGNACNPNDTPQQLQFSCGYEARLGVVASPVTSNPYPAGQLLVNGRAVSSVLAIGFKTFVSSTATAPAAAPPMILFLCGLLCLAGFFTARRALYSR